MKEISELLEITKSLKGKYDRAFTLDGKLVGDIGEVLAAEKYGLKLLAENGNTHDAIEINTGRFVQIKSSFRCSSTFPCGLVPEYYLAVQILETGELVELFNGPAQFIVDHYVVFRRLKANNGRYLYSLSGNILKQLNKLVPNEDKIGVK